MSYNDLLDESKQRMNKAVAHMQDQLKGIRTSRASSALIDNIRVDYYGTPTPISQLASISVPEPRQLVIKPFDLGAIQDLIKALQKSDLGITPESDGKIVRLTLPPLSGDQRKKYAAKAKELCEEGRVSLRNVRRDVNKQADLMQKSSEMTEDENRQLHDEIQKLLKTFEDKVGERQEAKTKEILEV
ncbi:MAG: ribosome recycling factor [Planctomycetota bacterium]|jgi:ribosome recycling factor